MSAVRNILTSSQSLSQSAKLRGKRVPNGQDLENWFQDLFNWFERLLEWHIKQKRLAECDQNSFQDYNIYKQEYHKWELVHRSWVQVHQSWVQKHHAWLQERQIKLHEQGQFQEMWWWQDPKSWVQERDSMQKDIERLKRSPASAGSQKCCQEYRGLMREYQSLYEKHEFLGGMASQANIILTTCITKLQERDQPNKTKTTELLTANKNRLLSMFLWQPSP